jgi:hypothetical protein
MSRQLGPSVLVDEGIVFGSRSGFFCITTPPSLFYLRFKVSLITSLCIGV